MTHHHPAPSPGIFRALAPLLALLALAACGTDNGADIRVSVIDADTRINLDGPRLGATERELKAATAQGLVRFDAAGDIIPGLAERWIVTDDGKSFIFRLRDARWQNGDPVTAEQVAAQLRERLDMGRRSRVAQDLVSVRDIRAMTGRVIEIRLLAPKPDLLNLLAQPELGIRRNGAGTGPLVSTLQEYWYALAERTEPSVEERRPDRSRTVFLRGERAALAIARFAADGSAIVLNGRFEDLPFLGAAGIQGNAVRFDPVSGLFGLVFVEDDGFLGDSLNREAIAMAIDRGQLMQGLSIGDWRTTSRYVPLGVTGHDDPVGERWDDLDQSQRRGIARQRVERWIVANTAIEPLRIALPAGPGARVLFAHLKADLSRIGLDAVRVGLAQDADLRLVDEVATYDRPTWYLNQISCTRRRICAKDADVVLAQAQRAVDPEVRRRKLAEAERLMTAENFFVPLGTPVRWSLVRPGTSGFQTTENALHPLPEIAKIPR